MSANLRAVAATCCYQVVDQGKSLSDVLPKAQLQFDNPADKALLQEICFGVLRHLPLLDFVCQQLMAKPLIKQLRPLQFLIYVGIYQLKFLRIPDHAAVGETVEAARYLKGQSMTKLINGVLRSVQRKPELFDVSQAPLPVQTNHPSWLVTSLQSAYPEQWQQILAANQQKAPLWLRVNVQRCSINEFCQALTAEGIEFSQPEPTLPQAILLAQATDVVLLPGYLDGWFAVQDLAAQYAAVFLAPKDNELVLDACCAPGGKTGHILEIAPKAQVLALDKDAKRLDRVRDNLTRLGHHAEIKAADAATPRQWWDGQQFDRILLDVPCSATGVIRRHPDIRWLRKAADIQALATLQQQILIQIWPLLKPGGTLLYATCSVLPAENQLQISQFLAHHSDAEAVALGAGINDSQMQILPGEQQADGFFYAKLSKKGERMKIIILGAGQVGATLAENLVGEENDITVVDINAEKLRALQDKFDLQVVHGHSAHPDILKKAGAEDADMIIAVTNSDEVNIVACQVAYSIFNTPTKVARIRTNQYIKYRDQLFNKDDMPVDHFIAPETLVTDYIRRLIDYPGALQVVEFAGGKVSLVAVKAYYGGLLVGHALSTLREHMPHIDARVAAIYRRGHAIKPIGTTIIEADDEVFFVAATKHIRAVMSELQKLENSYRRIMIAGGGNVGFGLAKALEKTHSVKLIERSKERAEYLSSTLENTVVYAGDASDPELLQEENIDQVDVFLAVTNDDEANIMSAMLAKRMGAQKTMVLIKRGAYVDLLQGGEVDIAVSPQQATISALLTHVRRGDIVNVYSLRRGAAEAIEAIAHGDKTTSKVVGQAIGKIKLPPGCTIGAIVRGDEVLIGHDATVIETDDHVILFLVDKKFIGEVERLFQVSAIFI